jgi:methyl-accepting chemotaxis protein
MLNQSVNKVTEIVSNTKTMMDRLIINSKEKIDTGSQTAKECALSLDEILTNVTHVNEMVKEISVASQEQSAGVREVNKAMGQLDQITQQNSASAEASDKAANELNSQVQLLNTIVKQLSTIVTGEVNPVVETPKVATTSEKVIHIRKKEVKAETKTVSFTPVSSDPRFEEA